MRVTGSVQWKTIHAVFFYFECVFDVLYYC